MIESPTQPASSLSGTQWQNIRPLKYSNYLKSVTTKGSLSPFDDSKLLTRFNMHILIKYCSSHFRSQGILHWWPPAVTVFPIQCPYWAYGLVCMLLYKSPTSHSSQVDAIAALQSFHIRKSQRLTDLARHI